MKTTLLASLLATATSAAFAFAPTANLNHDPATYKNVTQKAAADYKVATAKCTSLNGNAKEVCMEEARAARAHTEAEAIAQYNNTDKNRAKAYTAAADADYALAKAKCGDMSGAEKDSCLNNARSVHTAAIADAKAGRVVATTPTDTATATTTTGTTTTDTKAAAVDKCAQVGGSSKTGCLIDNRAAVTPSGATTAGAIANRTEATAETAADKTRNAAATVAEKTKDAAANVAEKTRDAVSNIADKTENKTEVAANKTGAAVSDSVITSKVKADLFKEPELKSMAIHVETEKGVVLLSGFVDSKADADKAVRLAKSVEGVTQVKSAIKVK